MPRHAIRWLVILGVALGLLASAAFIALQIVLPVFRFPAPGGPYAIGTVTYHWVDASRAELLSADPHARRELMAQISYPAKPNPAAPRAPYVQDADALAQALAGWKHWPRAVFGQLSYVTTNAVASAQVSDGKPNYPVLIFLEGAMGFRQMSSFQVVFGKEIWSK